MQSGQLFEHFIDSACAERSFQRSELYTAQNPFCKIMKNCMAIMPGYSTEPDLKAND
jgi:hypothetical protein